MVLIYLITTDVEEANEVGRQLITERLANSANIIPSASTIKWSNNKVINSTETLLLIKAKALLYSTIEKRVSELLKNANPSIFSIPMTQINHVYRDILNDGVVAV